MESTYYRKGFGLKAAITPQIASDYHSKIVDLFRSHDHVVTVGPLTFRLAREFGFCYGVDRAVEYAYETRTKFPDRRMLDRRRDHPQSACQRQTPGDGDRDPPPRRGRCL